MITRKPFLYFLLDTPTGKAYYRSATGTILTAVITAGIDVSSKNAPANWLETELGFIRNDTYHGINRHYGTPQEFVKGEYEMIRELYLLGVGSEVPLTLAAFKYNTQPNPGDPEYGIYYKATLDLSEIDCTVLESISAPLIQGGPAQLLKAYENTVIEIPCDGSIAENIKVNLDGLRVEDRFFYQFVPFTNTEIAHSSSGTNGIGTAPATFINNEADNYGIAYNSPSWDRSSSYGSTVEFLQQSGAWFFYSTDVITINIKGYILAASSKSSGIPFIMYLQSNRVTVIKTLAFRGVGSLLYGQERFNFDETITLQPNEKVFITCGGGFGDDESSGRLVVGGGSFSVSFSSQYKATRAWGITFADAFKYIWRKINELSNNVTGSNIIYPAVSELLDNNLNLFMTSGDALRASGDSTYQRYYYINSNKQISFGPVIKKTLKQLYEDAEAILFAALGTKGNEIYIERFAGSLPAVYNSDTVDFSLGELAFLKWRQSKKFSVSDFSIGYDPQTYDQKAGKYEYNTLLEMKAPITSYEKKIVKKAHSRTDSYGIERLRSNIGQATSTTRNDSDSGVFIINTNRDVSTYDFFKAYFSSLVDNPDDPDNTNVVYNDGWHQKFNLPITDGEYFQPNVDSAIFVFSEFGYLATEACNLTIDGSINSVNKPPLTPDDTVIIKIWLNGVVIYTNTTTVIGVNTPISINYNFSQVLKFSDCIYVTAETTATAEVQINTVDLTIGTYASMSGVNIPVLGGTFRKALSMPTVINSVTDGVKYDYQYFMYNSPVLNNIFELNMAVNGYTEGGTGSFVINVYINGLLQSENINITGTVPRIFFNGQLSAIINRAYDLGDIVFFTVNNSGQITYIQGAAAVISSDYILAYGLKRVQYDSLQGVPSLAKDTAGNYRTDIAGAPYNIEDLTPKTLYNKWKPWINSCSLDHVPGDFTFQTLSKNKYLSRTIGSLTVNEASNESILGNGRFAYPIEIEAGVNVALTFREMMKGLINTHVHATFMGNDIFFYIEEFKQRPALNESQTWKATLSDKTDLVTFNNISAFKLPDMAPNTIFCPILSTVQFVPVGQVQPAKYKTFSRNHFLFKEQVRRWSQRDGYCQPVQNGDPITLQFITRDLAPIIYTVYKCSDDSIYSGPTNLDTVAANAIVSPFILWQKYIDTSAWPAGDYYIVISNTTTGDLICSECLEVRADWPDTILAEFTSSQNTQQFVFLSEQQFIGSMRFKGMFDNRFKQKFAGRFYVDQPQDISILNAIPYETTTLFIGGDGGFPDYVHRKVFRMLLLDGLKLDGEAFSLNDGAELQDQFLTKGAPKTFKKIEIRPKNNQFGIVVDAGAVDDDASLLVTVDAGAFGPNDDNESGTTAPEIININITP